MSAFVLDEPRIAALRYVCDLSADERWIVSQWPIVTEGDRAIAAALRAISSPASAASLVRDLFWRAGANVLHEIRPQGLTRILITVRVPGLVLALFSVADVPRLVLALLALAPGDRKGAMRALREVGR